MPRTIALVGLALAGLATSVQAEPATARYAPLQLEAGRAALVQARAAVVRLDYAAVRSFAAQALLDARLAWSMTDSGFVRSAAAELAAEAERLRSRAVLARRPAALIRP